MGKQQSTTYYDKVYRESEKYNSQEPPQGYVDLWDKAIGMLEDDWDYILELGCGVGQFAKLLNGIGYSGYLGVDFSKQAIEKARKWNPGYAFLQADFFSGTFKSVIGNVKFDVVVCMETLEHIEKDMELLQMLPSDSNIVFSVPTFDCKSHVRCFPMYGNVESRYGSCVDFKEYSFVNEKYHLVKGKIK